MGKTGIDPIKVDVTRGNTTESSHLVHAIIMDKDGKPLREWGDMERIISPRSTLKPLQTLAFVESGAIEAFGLSSEEIALTCASHNAEKIHIEKVKNWLNKIGLKVSDMECGGHLSLNEGRAHEMIKTSEKICALHSDCSGKHMGMLSTAKHMGYDIKDYVSLEHPVQKEIYRIISEMTEYDLSKGHSGTDGCSAPNPAIPLKYLALGFSKFMNPGKLSEERAKSCETILDAMSSHPYILGGKERFCTALGEVSNGNIIGKLGAEGNYLCFIRDKGLTIYLKAEDGVLERATYPALGALLNELDVLTPKADKALKKFTRPILKNWTGKEIGKICVPELQWNVTLTPQLPQNSHPDP
ncbi:MAG: asparaginase [Alphaproteobacteria bacterium]|nr:asparaginase [Alphaproteobacteria bacterium]